MTMIQEEKFEEAKMLYKDANADQRYVLEKLFPKLSETEDEKIRKVLIDYFDDANKADENPLQNYGVHTDKVIAWLEKQGQVKNDSRKWSEQDDKKLRDCIHAIKNTFYVGSDELIQWLRDITNN